jgi:hypothetical protein
MLFSVNTNNNSLLAQQALMRTNVGLNKSVQKLSSGSRINSSADDAAGLSISENLKSGVYRSTGRNNGIAATAMLGDNANSALQTVSNTLMRMRELAIQTGSENLSTDYPTPGSPLTRNLASRIVDLARNGVVENPRVSMEAQANQSPDRAEFLLR